METIAADSGIDPVLIRLAAMEMDGRGTASQMLTRDKTATHNIVERIIPGPLEEEVWEDIVMELRHRYDSDMGVAMGAPEYGKSRTEQIGRSVEWRHTSMSGIETRVLIRPRGDRLHMRLSQRVGWGSTIAESITYGLFIAFIVGTVSGAMSDSGFLGVLILALTMAAAVPLIHWADTAWRKKKHNDLDALADRISTLLMLSPEPGSLHRDTVMETVAAQASTEMPIADPDAEKTPPISLEEGDPTDTLPPSGSNIKTPQRSTS